MSTLIEGFLLDISGSALGDHFVARAEYHDGRKKYWLDRISTLLQKKKEVVEAMDPADIDEDAVNSKMSSAYNARGQSELDMRSAFASEIKREKRFRFFAAHVDPGKLYRFKVSELRDLELIDE